VDKAPSFFPLWVSPCVYFPHSITRRPDMFAAWAVGGSAAWAHDAVSTVTWAVEVSRIVYKHCVSCHHDGGQAFSLVTYKDARPWAKAIRVDILERRMPPGVPSRASAIFATTPASRSWNAT
jgi:hypothetical protein